jgi:hypothetical protein
MYAGVPAGRLSSQSGISKTPATTAAAWPVSGQAYTQRSVSVVRPSASQHTNTCSPRRSTASVGTPL